MHVMPKKLDPKVKERNVQQMLEHVSESPNPTASAQRALQYSAAADKVWTRPILLCQVEALRLMTLASERSSQDRG